MNLLSFSLSFISSSIFFYYSKCFNSSNFSLCSSASSFSSYFLSYSSSFFSLSLIYLLSSVYFEYSFGYFDALLRSSSESQLRSYSISLSFMFRRFQVLSNSRFFSRSLFFSHLSRSSTFLWYLSSRSRSLERIFASLCFSLSCSLYLRRGSISYS